MPPADASRVPRCSRWYASADDPGAPAAPDRRKTAALLSSNSSTAHVQQRHGEPLRAGGSLLGLHRATAAAIPAGRACPVTRCAVVVSFSVCMFCQRKHRSAGTAHKDGAGRANRCSRLAAATSAAVRHDPDQPVNITPAACELQLSSQRRVALAVQLHAKRRVSIRQRSRETGQLPLRRGRSRPARGVHAKHAVLPHERRRLREQRHHPRRL